LAEPSGLPQPLTDAISAQSQLEALAPGMPHGAIVGIGASAGGLEAFTTFFRQMPTDSGLAFVLVQHLDPHQPSLLAELLGSQTAMPVHTIADQMPALPGNVYVIPPNTTLTIVQGTLMLAPPSEMRGRRMPIDHFLQSLAADQGARAIGIVFSGADMDGTLGLAAIQEAGGLTLAQVPQSARFATMPRSAIDRHVVDHVLPIEEMPALLRSYIEQGGALPLTSAQSPQIDASSGLQAICAILQRITGHDFRQYKSSTLLRRINRRMQLANLTDLGAYADHLRQNRPEVEQLFQDLLIGVTSFFRDPAAFEALAAEVIPTLLRSKGPDTPLRVWVAGCATGEEAYSVAMLLLDHMAQIDAPPPVQIFATDLDETALTVARQGRYDAGISAHVAPELLSQYFLLDGESYQVLKPLREQCIFSTHNLISDPPFARMDLILCRNLLIYFNADLQRQLVPLLHYALAPGGYLMLGSAENVTTYPELFRTVNLPQRIFQRNEALTRPAIPFPLTAPSHRQSRMADPTRAAPPSSVPDLGMLLERLMLKDHTPPAVVVNAQGVIIYFFGQTGAFLNPPAGAASLDIHAMVRPELSLALQAALRAAWRDQATVRSIVTIPDAGGPQHLTLIARPLTELSPGSRLTLLIFQETGPTQGELVGAADQQPSAAIVGQLVDELQTTRAALEATIAELREANAELTTANEELIATNEELQSANEELQTSKEEIQSINEELQTVNAELQRKIAELDRVNADLANLFASTQIPAIFLHADGRIARFTPAATDVFRLQATDVGRPITDIAARFHHEDLLALTERVLETLQPAEQAIHRQEPDAWWTMRIRPYRTLANQIDGVVITFTDITSLKRGESERERLLAEMQAARIYAEQIVATVVEPLLILDSDLRVQSANPAYYQRFATTAGETEQLALFALSGGTWDQPELRAQLDALRHRQISLLDLEVTQTIPALGIRTIRLQARPIEQLPNGAPLILLAIADITELTRAAAVLQEAHAALEQRVDERTLELGMVNATLQAEVAEHRRSEDVRQKLLQQLVTAQEEERRRIARELHDQLGQDLAGLILGLKALQDAVIQNAPATDRVRQLQELAMQIGQEVRTLAMQLRPAVLDDLGLAVALTNYVEQWSARTMVAVDLHATGLDTPQQLRLPLAVESTLYRLVQEALNNVLKHANAQGVSLILDRSAEEVRLIIEDDGVGFDIASVREHPADQQRLGLVGMEERVAQLGGMLTIESTPGTGTTVFVSIPIATAASGGADDTHTNLSG
jgi:two-component system, chemotaxis family, CheB/CheR fusion protein